MSHAHLTPTLSWRQPCAASRRRQRGFSLLEALVSIVVLSFGLLGVAGLQASALKYSRDARNQSVAVNLAREMAEMIRSNARESAKSSSEYLQVGSDAAPEDLSGASAPGGAKAIGPFTGGDKLAEGQVLDWKYRLGQALPGAYATVCLDKTPYDSEGLPQWGCSGDGDVIAIKIGWEREDTAGAVKGATDAGVRPFVVLPVTPAGQQQ